jgi:ATP-binding cassette subfamily C protein EexD
VLDEPNAHLDEVGERALALALQQIKLTGATVFVIAHRTSILAQLDRLLVMNAGTISLYGPRDQVLAQLNAQQLPAQQKPAARAGTEVASTEG